ncbi:MAG: Ig-like domain-containing protein [Bacteroidales bacterium]|jgi:hypothetical protein|nr:Ig-like domain-containing protein [Bacteroidales bacterium]
MNKKYFFLGLTIFAISVFLFSACQKLNPEIPIPELPIPEPLNPEPILVSDLILNKNELILEVGKTETLIATIYPENATNKKLTWYSDNPGSVTVNNDGLVTAVNKGMATITVTAEEGGNYKQAKCYIKVGDYRAKWVGNWDFVVKSTFWVYPPDGNPYIGFDTLYYYLGIISLGDELNQLNINFIKNYSTLVNVDESGIITGNYFPVRGQFEEKNKVSIEAETIMQGCKTCYTINGIKKEGGKK